MHSPPLLVRVLVLSVSIHCPRRIYDPIVIFQVFSPANVVFLGIGVLLLASIILDPSLSVPAIVTMGIS